MYKVRWEINVDGETPVEAAKEALRIQTDPESTALVFEVFDEAGKVTMVDLWKEVTG